MSNYITKDIARQTAIKMIAKIEAKVKNKKAELSELIIENYNKNLPKEILEASLKYPNYFKKSSQVLLKENGLNDSFSLTKSVCSTLDTYQVVFIPEVAIAKLLSKGIIELNKLENKKKELRIQIENTLLNLKTYKRIQDQFPEAFEFLPEKAQTDNALAIPIDDIRKQLSAIK